MFNDNEDAEDKMSDALTIGCLVIAFIAGLIVIPFVLSLVVR